MVRLVRAACGASRSDGDALALKLHRLFETFPPDERVLRRLSLAEQRTRGTGGLEDFCATSVYSVASQVAATLPSPKARHRRSAPARVAARE